MDAEVCHVFCKGKSRASLALLFEALYVSKAAVLIRAERDSDQQAIFDLNASAFGSDLEAKLIDRVRGSCSEFISLVAEDGGTIVGHILLTPVTLQTDITEAIFGLGPMAVIPSRQRQGIGTALVKKGLDRCRAAGVSAVVVLGFWLL